MEPRLQSFTDSVQSWSSAANRKWNVSFHWHWPSEAFSARVFFVVTARSDCCISTLTKKASGRGERWRQPLHTWATGDRSEWSSSWTYRWWAVRRMLGGSERRGPGAGCVRWPAGSRWSGAAQRGTPEIKGLDHILKSFFNPESKIYVFLQFVALFSHRDCFWLAGILTFLLQI